MLNLRRLGSDYGGWYFHDHANLYDSVFLSAGAGEDVSFDVEFAAEYRASGILVDPTPRAVDHFELLRQRLGNQASREYSKDGKQPVESYDLSALTPSSLTLVPKALWKNSRKLKLHAPPDSRYVSYSINRKPSSPNHLSAESITPKALARSQQFVLAKLDIEGAELAVIPRMVKKMHSLEQLLVEFDSLRVPGGKPRVKRLIDWLARRGFSPEHKDRRNYLFVHWTRVNTDRSQR